VTIEKLKNKHMKKQFIRSNAAFVLMLSVLLLNQPVKSQAVNVDDFSAEMAVAWNKKVMEMAVAEDGLLTLKGLRTVAMMHVAMHDALNAIAPLFSKYSNIGNEPSADPVASAAQAAYQVAISQYQDKAQQLNEELKKWLGMVKESKNKTLGIRLGKEAASAILAKRMNDRWNGEAEYTWHPMGPGVYAEFNEHSGTPEGFVFGAGWAAAEPFMLPTQDYFRSPPPPEINSDEYTKAFNEVKEFGRFQSNSRTVDQTHLAMWWKDFVENSHNRLARQLVVTEKLNLWDATRLFALMNMSIYDAYINVFENKFFYNHWRPYTAIRWAANDGNPDTQPEADWNNLHKHTYAFPSYPSAHGTVSAAAMTILANTLGAGDNYTFTMTIAEVDKAGPMSGKIKTSPPTRTFNSFSEAAMECSMSRMFLGIHFRYDSMEGNKLGTKIGNYAFANFLMPKD
jgi:hypothetical protein